MNTDSLTNAFSLNLLLATGAAAIFIWRGMRSFFENRKDRARDAEEQAKAEASAAEKAAREAAEKKKSQQRKKELLAKYGDEFVAIQIMYNEVWVGMTEEQLRDSLGRPTAKSFNETTRDRKETWKYEQTRSNAYALKITLKNGIVEKISDTRGT